MGEILRLLQDRHAALWPEIEARLADHPHPQARYGIDPHWLTNARTTLVSTGQIVETQETTRGGRSIGVYVLKRRGLTETTVKETAARKRLLEARYLSWTTASRSARRPNLIGEGG
jgi:hypothetical protein